jgi:hypothetical protein
MSHVAYFEGLKITDLDALEAACKTCGLEFMRDQRTYAWWGYSAGDYPLPEGMTEKDLGKCRHAIKVAGTTPKNGTSGPWEIGMVERDGVLMPIRDFFGPAWGALEAKVGKNFTKLAQEYHSEVVLREMYRQGFRVETRIKDDGTRQFIGSR